ncbi:MAG: hypothetical protein M1455_06445 [Actinobacteria bacterium]|nr:hypothetical protein [Actinomycetota bacterium]
MTERYKNFDAAWQEHKGKPLIATVLGADYELPPKLPASVVLRVIRLKNKGRNYSDLTREEIIEFAVDMIPKAVLDEWLGKGMDTDQIADIILWAFHQYQGGGGDQGEVPAPTTGADQTSEHSTLS